MAKLNEVLEKDLDCLELDLNSVSYIYKYQSFR